MTGASKNLVLASYWCRQTVPENFPVCHNYGNRNFRSHVLSLSGAKVPYMELSFPGTFVPLSENEVELLLLTQS